MNKYTETPVCSGESPNSSKGNTINRHQRKNVELYAFNVCQDYSTKTSPILRSELRSDMSSLLQHSFIHVILCLYDSNQTDQILVHCIGIAICQTYQYTQCCNKVASFGFVKKKRAIQFQKTSILHAMKPFSFSFFNSRSSLRNSEILVCSGFT